MKKIFICCVSGISTSMVVKKMMQAARERGIDIKVVAVRIDMFDSNLPHFDGCLLGPQVKSKFDECKKKGNELGKLVEVIDSTDYGMMNGNKILNQALAMFD